MNLKKDELQSKQIEEAISHIGVKVANAVEASQQAKVLSAKSEAILINIQQDLEDLYISMDVGEEKAEQIEKEQ